MWSIRELTRDAYRNLSWPHAILAVVAILTLTTASMILVRQADASLTQERDLRRGGTAIWSAADDNGQMSSQICQDLALQSGVMASGAVVPGPHPPLSAVPDGAPLPVNVVTPGYVNVFVPAAQPGAITIGPELTELGQASVGQFLYDGRDPIVRIDTILPTWTPVPTLRAAIALPGYSTALVGECWIRMHPSAAEHGAEVLLAAFGNDIRISRFAPPPTATASPWDQWVSIAGLHPALLAGGVLAMLSLMLHWARRSEFAVRRVFGSRPSDIATACAVEALLTLAPAALISIAITLLGTGLPAGVISEPTLPITVNTVIGGALVGAASYTLLALVISRTRTADALKDR